MYPICLPYVWEDHLSCLPIPGSISTCERRQDLTHTISSCWAVNGNAYLVDRTMQWKAYWCNRHFISVVCKTVSGAIQEWRFAYWSLRRVHHINASFQCATLWSAELLRKMCMKIWNSRFRTAWNSMPRSGFLGVLLKSHLEQSWVRWQPSNENCSTDVPSCLNWNFTLERMTFLESNRYDLYY